MTNILTLNISAFTHVGTLRKINQDNILVNGHLLNNGEVHLANQSSCFCFVADGVSGNKAGEFASNFVLEKLNGVITANGSTNLEQLLLEINERLLSESKANEEIRGTTTTLTGLVVNENNFQIIHVGDSQMWLLRNEIFFQVTKDQVLDESIVNSPITSYFGGNENYLNFDKDIAVKEMLINDLFLICSDGIMKSMNIKVLKSILKADKDIQTKLKKIFENCINEGAEDNISAILIHLTS